MSKMMKFRRIEISIGIWEDKPSFEISDREITEAMLRAFPGAHVGIVDDFMHTYEVREREEENNG